MKWRVVSIVLCVGGMHCRNEYLNLQRLRSVPSSRIVSMASATPEHPRADLRGAPAIASSAIAATEVTLSDAVTTLRKRKWIVIALALCGVLYGIYKGRTQPRLFTAEGRIEIRAGSANQYRVSGVSDGGGTVRLNSEVVILKSDTLLFTVAEDMDLANNPAFLGIPSRPAVRANYADPAVHEAIVGQLAGVINILPINKTDLVMISARTGNARLSADIVNKLIEEYITRSFKSRVEATIRASNFMTKELDDLKHEVETSQAQVIDLQKRLGVVAIDPTHSQISSTLEALTTASSTAELARILAESRYRVLIGMDRNALDQTVANAEPNVAASHLSGLRAERDTTYATLASLTAAGGLGPKNPQVLALQANISELDKQIAEEQTRVIAQAKETLVAAQANENATRGALEAEKTAAEKLRDDIVEYSIHQREFESERTLYEGLLERLRTATVQAGLESTEIEIIDQALPPSSPSLESRSSLILTDTFAAIVIGMILAFLIESLDTGLRSVADIESVSGLPSLALIPRARRTGVDVSNLSVAQRNLGSLSSPKSQFTESFRALRTSLLLSTAGRMPQVILLTSATPSEGKTTVSTNLACVFAQNNVRVLLIDGDLRRPTIHHRLGLNGKVGLTSVLTGTSTLEQAVQNLPEVPTLDILVSGPVPPFPTEMLSSQTMTDLMAYTRGIYTHIIIDSPPLLSVTDGVVMASTSDAVVLIVRHGRSGRQTVRRARDLLLRSHAPITGVAINAVDLSSPEYYGYYGYSAYAGYGSSNAESSAWSPTAKSDSKRSSDREKSDPS
jgi:succinoglycan biosynthesis transport protein ExoP